MNHIALAASLLAALVVAGCAVDTRQSVFGNEPNPYACSDSTDWLAQKNLCRESPSM
jgi:PBP1b-binding outer membrane lipoprotein LpoB